LNSVTTLDELQVEFTELADESVVDAAVSWADVVLVHWWNHPLLNQLLLNYSLPPARIVFWCHISGSPAPNVLTSFALRYPDIFVFTTPLSFLSPEVQRATADGPKLHLETIWSTAGVERLSAFQDHANSGVKACYVGSLDYTKMHTLFLDAAAKLSHRGINLTIVGPLTEDFKSDLSNLPISERPRVLGYVDETVKFRELASAGLFFYPLARHHYATCDQALQEAMALGAVPLVLNNGMESYMVKDGLTGIVSRSMDELVEKTIKLSMDDSQRLKLATNAKDFATSAYSIHALGLSWIELFRSMATSQKRLHPSLSQAKGYLLTPHEIFLESLGNFDGAFRLDLSAETLDEKRDAGAQVALLAAHGNWSTASKGSATQYYHVFPNDEWLARWASLLRPPRKRVF